MGLRLRKHRRVYLDWASAAQICASAQKAFTDAGTLYGNPSSPHEEGRKAKEILEDARSRIAKLCGVKAGAVVMTSGATEANALALQGRIRTCEQIGMARSQMHILYLPTMHSSVVKTIQEFAKTGICTEAIPLAHGQINISACAALLRPETVLVTCDVVCGETGSRFDTRALRTLIDKAGYAGSALLHVDASHVPLVEMIERTRLGADLMTLDASKVGGVRGIGALIVPHARSISPIVFGGGQEHGLRPGTESVALAASFATALEDAQAGHKEFSKRARELRGALLDRLTSVGHSSYGVPTMMVTVGKEFSSHILNLSFLGRDTDYLVMLLDAAGYAVSTKSACETDSEGSAVVYALTGDKARSMSTLRISFGPSTKRGEVKRFSKALRSALDFLDNP